MPLSIGERLGLYEIRASIGAGGMGEVYRALDTKLEREVAIKVLPATLARDPERLARFEREARVLASLNHPNIAQIYGIEESSTGRALVMELIPGEILRAPLPLNEALRIAGQIAEALEAAHDKGIIHRDLKPANIMITPGGVVKILDFGLAAVSHASVASSGDPRNSPTLTIGATQAGMILGTAGYMSPEQAAGQPVDKRADIWSFGVVLWEMLTGQGLFRGDTVTHILADVLRAPIDVDKLPAGTPRGIRDLVKRCLDRDVKTRLRDIGEARIAIQNAGKEPDATISPETTSLSGRIPWIAAGVMTVAAAVAFWAPWRSAVPADRPLMRFSVDLGPEAVATGNITAAISLDATRLAYSARSPDGKQVLATRPLNQAKAAFLAGTENAIDPFFSPDGQWIGFFADNKMQKISVQGGAPVVLADSSNSRGAGWGDDGTIVAELVNTAGLTRIPAEGGAARPVTTLSPGEATHRWPQVLPGSQTILFTASKNISAFDDASIEVLSLKNNQRKTLWHGGYFGRYLPINGSQGSLVFIHHGTLFGAPLDLNRLELQGTPVPILDDVASDPTTAGGQLDVAALAGALVYRSGKAVAQTWQVSWLDSSGKTQRLLEKPGAYYTPRISPDGRRLAISLETGKDMDVWTYDLQRESMSRLTYTAQGGLYPLWSPDGKYIVFEARSSSISSIQWIRSDGAGEVQKLLESENELIPGSLSPDGRRLAYTGVSRETGYDLWTVALDLSDPEHPKPGKPELFLRTPANEHDPAFSPDGRWIAYTSTESGIGEVYVRPFPGPGGKWQISSGGAKYARWSRNGHALFYQALGDGAIMAADYTATADSFSSAKPRVAVSAKMNDATGDSNWDLAPDGKHFVVFPAREQEAEDKGSVHVTFLLNFLDEVHRRIPIGK